MELLVNRTEYQTGCTVGEFDIDSHPFCFTLEDVVRPAGVKVQNETAIPAGRYRVRMTWSNRFKKPMPELMNVPMFAGVRIHGGNTAEDTEGCILIGMHRSRSAIDTCAPACEAVYKLIDDAEKQGEVWITIRDSKAV